VAPCPRINTSNASFLRERSISIGGATTMGGPSARTSTCSHEKKKSPFQKMLRWKLELQSFLEMVVRLGDWVLQEIVWINVAQDIIQ
jgi:hypothetical protein